MLIKQNTWPTLEALKTLFLSSKKLIKIHTQHKKPR